MDASIGIGGISTGAGYQREKSKEVGSSFSESNSTNSMTIASRKTCERTHFTIDTIKLKDSSIDAILAIADKDVPDNERTERIKNLLRGKDIIYRNLQKDQFSPSIFL